jgi:hypothetical protein
MAAEVLEVIIGLAFSADIGCISCTSSSLRVRASGLKCQKAPLYVSHLHVS